MVTYSIYVKESRQYNCSYLLFYDRLMVLDVIVGVECFFCIGPVRIW